MSYFDHLGIWWIMYQTPWPLARATAVSMILLFWGGSSPETHYLWKPFKREWKKRSGIQLTKALSRPEIGWVWQDVSPSDPLPSQYFLTVGVWGGDIQDDPYCTFSTGVMKVRAAEALPTSRITLNTSGDRGCQLAGKTPGSDGRCALPICLLHGSSISGDPGGNFLSYQIKFLGYGLQL